jgi:hypothetical protein
METIFADIGQEWEPLSSDHKKLESYFDRVVRTIVAKDSN